MIERKIFFRKGKGIFVKVELTSFEHAVGSHGLLFYPIGAYLARFTPGKTATFAFLIPFYITRRDTPP